MKDEKEQTVIEKTYMYLENYKKIERYIKDAVSEASQITEMDIYSISAEQAFLKSIRECKAETVILYEHIKRALELVKEDAVAAGEEYKYDALEMIYIKGLSYEEVAKRYGCGKNSPKRWCKSMVQNLSIRLFGARALEERIQRNNK